MSLMWAAPARCVSCAYRRQDPAARIASVFTVNPYPSSERTPNCLISRAAESSLCQSQSSRGVSVAAKPLASRDRKSTRLNSSHANISYAVFCLKKKKRRVRKKVNRKIMKNYKQKQQSTENNK